MTIGNLHDWLDTATKGLTGESSARVECEITAHYRDMMAAERREGRSHAEERAAVMAALGSPTTARRLSWLFHKVAKARGGGATLDKPDTMTGAR